jgi:flavodoxin
MKIAILYDSKFGNTKKVAEFLAENMQASNHQVRLFRTTETRPQDLILFQQVVMLVGGPTHGRNPAYTLGKYIKNLGKGAQEITIRKAAFFNCNNDTNVYKKIESQILKMLPKIEIYEKSLPIKTGGLRGPLPDNWKDAASVFISAFLSTL